MANDFDDTGNHSANIHETEHKSLQVESHQIRTY